MTPAHDDLRRAGSWVEHLRAGGSTPYAEWAAPAAAGSPGAGDGDAVPGAQRLELLRRLNEQGPVDEVVVDAVLNGEPHGRGLRNLPLPGMTSATYAAAPTDPGDIGAPELLRVAAGVLADCARTLGEGQRPARRKGLRRPWAKQFRVVGSPLHADAWRTELLAHGRRPGDQDAVAVLLAEDFSSLFLDVWEWRIREGATLSWSRWAHQWRERDELPGRMDLARVADRWAERVGRDRLHVVIDGRDVPEIFGVGFDVDPPARFGIVTLDLLRRVNRVLRTTVTPERHRQLLSTTVLPLLVAEGGEHPTLPADTHAWLRRRAEEQVGLLRDRGIAVHGDLDRLVPPEWLTTGEGASAGRDPEPAVVLTTALRTLGRVARKDSQ